MSDIFQNFIYSDYPQAKPGELLNNYVGVQVFFSTLNYLEITVNPAYSIMALFSDIGGALGLLLGATLLTIYEIIEFCFKLYRGLRNISVPQNTQTNAIQAYILLSARYI